MADDPIKSFMVELGFVGDAAGAKKVVDLANKTEGAITRAAEEGAEKRVSTETQTNTTRIGLAGGLGKILVELEQQRVERTAKIKKDEAAQDERLTAERERKARERRAAALKEIQIQATRMASFALKAVGAIEATALGIVFATDRAAKGFERLNYVSQRAGSTASKTTAVGYAFSQLGGQAVDGEAAVSAVGGRLKENPAGYSAALKSIGVEARKANGEMRDTADIVTDLGEALARIRKQGGQYGYAQAKARGAQFGLGEDQAQTLMDPRFRAMESEGAAIDAKTGADRDKAAAGGTKFEQSMRRLEAMADSIRTKISTSLFVTLTPELDKLGKWVEEHGDQIVKTVDQIVTALIRFAEDGLKKLAGADWDAVLQDIGVLANKFVAIANALETTTSKFIAFGTAVQDKVVGPIEKLLGFLGKIDQATSLNLGGVFSDLKAIGKVDQATSTNPSGVASDLKDIGAVDQATSTNGGGLWAKLKNMVGLGTSDPDSHRVKDAIIATAEGVKKLAEKADGVGDGAGGAMSAANRTLGWAGRAMGGGAGRGDGAPLHFAGFGNGGWEKSGSNKQEVADYIRHAAAKAGVDPETAVRVAHSEGLGSYVGDYGTSFGPFQLHYGGSGIRGMNSGGLGDRFTKETGLDARDPRTWKSQVDYAMRMAKREGWSAWHGAAHVGIGNRQGLDYNGPIPPEPASTQQAGGSSSESVGEKIAGMKSAGLLTDEQCVTLAMASVGVRKGSGQAGSNVHDWRKGEGADTGTLRPGTPVATFLDRLGRETDRYAGGGAGTPGAHLDHAGVFQKYVMDAYGKRIGMTIAEQYQGSHGVHLKDYMFGKGFGEANGSNYHAIMGPDGRPLGGQPVKVDITDKSAERIGRGVARVGLGHRGDHLAATQAVLRTHRGQMMGVDPHSSLGRSIRHSIDMSRRHVAMTNAPVFNIHGVTDTGAAMADAHRTAGRGQADLVRNMSVMTS